MILRANAGDWIEVTLHNLFNPAVPVPYFDYPTVPLDQKHRPSMRVSMNPQFLHYDPVCDSGINAGYNNREQTVGPGESKKYLWYADQEYGPCIIQSLMPADKPRNVGFCIHGHEWKEQPDDPYSRGISMQGAVSIGNTYSMELKDGASCPGDYLYRSGSLKWDVESGMWGIFRVLKQGIRCRCRSVCRRAMDCICGK